MAQLILLLFLVLFTGCSPVTFAPAYPKATEGAIQAHSATITQGLTIVTTSPSETVLRTITPTIAPTESPTIAAIPAIQLPALLQSTWIAFIGNGYSGVYLVRPDGSDVRNIYFNPGTFVSEPSWSPDGHRLAITYSIPYDLNWNGDFQIFIIDIDGKNLRQLTYEKGRVNSYPSWSPDGKWIAYQSMYFLNNQAFSDIEIVASGGGTPRVLVKNGFVNTSPIWAQDGKSIYYMASRSLDDIHILMSIDLDSFHERVEFHPPDSTFGFRISSIAYDEGKILLDNGNLSGSGDECLGIMEFSLKNESRKILPFKAWTLAMPTFSPNSRYIALLIDTGKACRGYADDWGLYIMDLQTGTVKQVIEEIIGHADTPSWHPDTPAWSPVPTLQHQQNYLITALGDRLNLHSKAAIGSNVIQQLKQGEKIIVLEGPVDADGYYWWRIRTADGVEGWAVEVAGWYAPLEQPGTSTVTPAP